MATGTTVRNVTRGFRGLNLADGTYLELGPGEMREGVELTAGERKSAEGTAYFEFGSAAAKEPAPAPAPGAAGAELPNNVPQLKKIARDEGVELGTAKKAADIKAAITAARAAKAAGGAPTPTPPADDLDNAADDDLRVIVAGLTGKPVEDYATTERDELLRLAREKPAE